MPRLASRGIEADFGPENADTCRRDLHPDLRADYVLADGLIDRVHRELTDADLTYHAWRGDAGLTRSRGERGEKTSGWESLRASGESARLEQAVRENLRGLGYA